MTVYCKNVLTKVQTCYISELYMHICGMTSVLGCWANSYGPLDSSSVEKSKNIEILKTFYKHNTSLYYEYRHYKGISLVLYYSRTYSFVTSYRKKILNR